MTRWAVVMALCTGCGGLSMEIVQSPCEDVNLTDPGPDEIVVEERGVDLLVYRAVSFAGADDVFDPELDIGDKPVFGARRFFVYEAWEAGVSDLDLCFFPGVLIYDPPGGTYNFEWYEEGGTIPVARLEYKR